MPNYDEKCFDIFFSLKKNMKTTPFILNNHAYWDAVQKTEVFTPLIHIKLFAVFESLNLLANRLKGNYGSGTKHIRKKIYVFKTPLAVPFLRVPIGQW